MSLLRLKSVPVALCLVLGLAACGDDSSSTSTDAVTTPVDDGDGGGYDYGSPTPDDSTPATEAPETSATSTAHELVVKREGNILVDGDGFALYIFANDPPDTSTCNAGCVETWPPLLVDDGGFTLQGDVDPTDFGVIVRDDGTSQVSYQGQPLYYYVGDTAPGDTNGDGIGGVWFVVEFA